MSLKDALYFAIPIEEEAEERHREFVHQMETHDTPGVARFFRFMSVNEALDLADDAKRGVRLLQR